MAQDFEYSPMSSRKKGPRSQGVVRPCLLVYSDHRKGQLICLAIELTQITGQNGPTVFFGQNII